MPIKFYGYGYDRNDKSGLPMHEQQGLIWFNQQKALGSLPSDTEWGGYFGDTERKRTVKFLHRPMGKYLWTKVRPGDRICVSSHDRIIGSTVGATETLDWAIEQKVHLVFIDLNVDSSTPEGRHTLEVLRIVKRQERREHSRRQCRDIADRRREPHQQILEIRRLPLLAPRQRPAFLAAVVVLTCVRFVDGVLAAARPN